MSELTIDELIARAARYTASINDDIAPPPADDPPKHYEGCCPACNAQHDALHAAIEKLTGVLVKLERHQRLNSSWWER